MCFIAIVLCTYLPVLSQTHDEECVDRDANSVVDSIEHVIDQVVANVTDSLVFGDDSVEVQMVDSATLVSLSQQAISSIENKRFVPDAKKAMWLAIAFPGGGQIYNRKYWKLPIVYGGFLGCVYAMTWNNTMYRDYSQAYIDIMDTDENTKSYENFIPKRFDINANMDRLKELFKRKKNYYRRYRDLSMFCMIGVYALSIIDAYVDAEMSSFDISTDLSLKVHPTIMNESHSTMRASGMNTNSYGLQCSFVF